MNDSSIEPTRTERDRLIADAVAYARQSAFYKAHLAGAYVNGRADLARLPLTTKDHLRQASPYGMLAIEPHRVWHYHESSGTTGEPIATWAGLKEVQRMGSIIHAMVPELSQPSTLLNRFPLFSPVSFVFEEAMRQAEMCHIAAGNFSWDVPFSRVLEFIHRLKVTALSTLPLEPILLRELAETEGRSMRDFDSLKVIFCGGAILPASMRRLIERDWSARIVEIYGSNETLLLGVGCTAGRTHLCEELNEFEVLDPTTHQPVANGEAGILTVTSLAHEAAPLVRYYTGDIVRVSSEPCPCGNPTATMQCLGRYGDRIIYGGASITPLELLDAAYEFAEHLGTRTFFIVLLQKNVRFLVEVEHPTRFRGSEAERRFVERAIVPIEVEYLDKNDVMDRSALFRSPKIYKPSQISDWRGGGRKTITIMEALLEWPTYDRRTIFHIVKRQIRNGLRRRRFIKSDR